MGWRAGTLSGWSHGDGREETGERRRERWDEAGLKGSGNFPPFPGASGRPCSPGALRGTGESTPDGAPDSLRSPGGWSGAALRGRDGVRAAGLRRLSGGGRDSCRWERTRPGAVRERRRKRCEMAGHRAGCEGMAAALWRGRRGDFLRSSSLPGPLSLSGDEVARDSAQESGGQRSGAPGRGRAPQSWDGAFRFSRGFRSAAGSHTALLPAPLTPRGEDFTGMLPMG